MKLPVQNPTEWEDCIVCPRCGTVDEETNDYPPSLQHDGDAAPYSCSECGTDFTVTISVSYEYQSRYAKQEET